MCSLRSSVALVVIGIAFLSNKHAILNSSPYKLVFRVILIKSRLCRANHTNEISI